MSSHEVMLICLEMLQVKKPSLRSGPRQLKEGTVTFCFDVHCYHCSLAAIACKFWLSGCGKTLSSPSSTILYVDFFGSRILEDVAAISCVTPGVATVEL